MFIIVLEEITKKYYPMFHHKYKNIDIYCDDEKYAVYKIDGEVKSTDKFKTIEELLSYIKDEIDFGELNGRFI